MVILLPNCSDKGVINFDSLMMLEENKGSSKKLIGKKKDISFKCRIYDYRR